MRLFDTYSKSLVELPPPPGPVRMYFCGPTVYARAHVGNARPFVVGMWLRRWLRERGYEATLVHNITDVNDKIYDAAPGASAALAEQATALVPRGHRRPRARHARPPAEGDRARSPGSSRFIEAAGRARLRVRGRGRRLLPRRAASPSTGGSPASGPTRSRSRSRTRSRRTRATSRSGRRTSRARTRRGTRRGAAAGRAGTSSARRWPRSCSAPSFEIHGGGLDLVFPHHENELAQSRALGHPFAQIWAHNGLLQFTGEKMSKSVGNIATLREVLDEWGRETLLRLLPRRRTGASRSTSPTRRWRRRRAQRRDVPQRVPRDAERAGGGEWDALVAALEDDFNTPEALALLHEWARRDLDLLRRGARRSSGSARSPSEQTRPAEVVAARRAARGARARARLRPSRPAARRDRGRGLGDAGRAGGYTLVPKRVTARPRLRAAAGPRGAARAAARCSRSGRPSGRSRGEPWLAEARSRARQARARPDRARRARATTRASSPACEPYRYADAYELAEVDKPLLAVLDQVTDPHNLGAVCRSAEGAGATGVVVPAHGSARRHRRGRAGLGRRDRAPADRRRHEPRALPRAR